MARFCGQCGAPLGNSDRCLRCGWTAPPVSVPKKRKKAVLFWLLFGGLLAVLLILGTVLGVVLARRKKRTVPTGSAEWPPAEEYLSELGSISGRKSASAAALRTEAEALREYAARGFADAELTACFDVNGGYLGEQPVSGGREKHPGYAAIYRTPDGVFWNVVLTADRFFAHPLSYNAEGRWSAPHVLAETGDFLSYDDETNTFYTVEPDAAGLVVKRVGRIDAATLDAMSAQEVNEP